MTLASDPPVNLKTSRVEALSDGVFAIAMTILLLNISAPTADAVSADRLPDAFSRVAPQVIVYVISFVNLGVLRVGQHCCSTSCRSCWTGIFRAEST